MRDLVIYLIGINLLTFLLYGIDKWKAQHKKWRIPEDILLFLPIIGGSLGALLAMAIFHHKTRHRRFLIVVPLVLVAQVIFLILYLT